MTLIAFTVTPGYAEVISDTWSYAPRKVTMGEESKVLHLPLIDSVLAAQGSVAVARRAMVIAQTWSHEQPTFDRFAEEFAEALRGLWENVWGDPVRQAQVPHPADRSAQMLLVGRSESRGRYIGIQLASDWDFNPVVIEDTYITPAPWSHRPGPLELQRMRADFEDMPDDYDDLDDAEKATIERLKLELDAWAQRPQLSKVTGVKRWTTIALQTRRERSLDLFGRTMIGGHLDYTRLEPQKITTRRLLNFEKVDGIPLADLVRGSLHPTAQWQPCGCGSGQATVECCMSHAMDESCGCGSRRPFRDCHLIERPA